MVRAWRAFKDAYRNYPLNIMFSYYGPAHDGVVWKLALKPKNFPLPRTWQGTDPIDGDRIGEALLNGHTLDEALCLVEKMSTEWSNGVELLCGIDAEYEDEAEQVSVAKAIGLLFSSCANILRFYLLRDDLGRNINGAFWTLLHMRELVKKEIENSRAMTPLCENDGRLGYHSEAEGYKFFPEKLCDRIAQLEELLETEFPEVEKRVSAGLAPLEYYLGVEDAPDVKRYKAHAGALSEAAWEPIGDGADSKFRIAYGESEIRIELSSSKKVTFTLAPEFRLLYPDAVVHIFADGEVKLGKDAFLYNSLFGEREAREYAKYSRIRATKDAGTHIVLTLDAAQVGLKSVRPFKMKIMADDVSWCTEKDPMPLLGKSVVIPGDYGWILP